MKDPLFWRVSLVLLHWFPPVSLCRPPLPFPTSFSSAFHIPSTWDILHPDCQAANLVPFDSNGSHSRSLWRIIFEIVLYAICLCLLHSSLLSGIFGLFIIICRTQISCPLPVVSIVYYPSNVWKSLEEPMASKHLVNECVDDVNIF